MSGPEDQRIDPRYPMVLRADFPDRKELLDATENLSTGGVFVRSDRTFTVGPPSASDYRRARATRRRAAARPGS